MATGPPACTPIESAARHADAGDSYLQAKLALNLGAWATSNWLTCPPPSASSAMASPPLSAAHREFEAEAHWHLAQTALARKTSFRRG